jgi:ACT domain-containing protein
VAKKETDSKINGKIKNKVTLSDGINLIPPATDSEIILEEKKGTFNMGGAIAILIFVILSAAVFGYNIVIKLQLNSAKQAVLDAEGDVGTYSDLISMNEEMRKRIMIYDQVQESTVSYKNVFDYWDSVSNATSKIDSIKLTTSLTFSVTGKAGSLSDVSKMWHLLSTDSRVLNVNLKSVGSGSGGVNYEFEGKLDYEYFKALNLTQ